MGRFKFLGTGVVKVVRVLGPRPMNRTLRLRSDDAKRALFSRSFRRVFGLHAVHESPDSQRKKISTAGRGKIKFRELATASVTSLVEDLDGSLVEFQFHGGD